MKPKSLLICLVLAVPGTGIAQDKSFTLAAPDALVETGFLKHLLPRFSLKTSIRISVDNNGAMATLGDTGTPVFKGPDRLWHLSKTDGPHTDAFADWLLSDVGKRTIEAFKVGDVALFSADVTKAAVVRTVTLDGDAVKGEKISHTMCGRCHVVSEKNRMNAIGSSPSFALMRTFSDWQNRFEAFFTLKPHPAFTQIEDVTEPFDETLPSPIAPLELTLEDIEAILAYVASVEPADLGAPIQTQ